MDCFESLWVLKGNRKETATKNQAFLAPRSPQILTLFFKDLMVMNSPVQHMVPIIWGDHDLGNLMKPHETRGFPPAFRLNLKKKLDNPTTRGVPVTEASLQSFYHLQMD
jgi:hypothetical protein